MVRNPYVTIFAMILVAISLMSTVLFLILCSPLIDEVTVTVLDPSEEFRDTDPDELVRENDELPDYRLNVLGHKDRVYTVTTKPNQSAEGGISWRFKEPIPRLSATKLILIEDDGRSSQNLDSTVPAGASETQYYRYEVGTRFSLGDGAKYFVATWTGRILIVLVICSMGAILWNNALPSHSKQRAFRILDSKGSR